MARTPSKPHIPYRGDDPLVGKKTGIKVPPVSRTSDGYEEFGDLLDQAQTPPRRKKKRVSDGEEEGENDQEEDEDGEESMDVDSPVNYSTTPRAAASTRPNIRETSVDFDAVPSPRARKSVGRAGPSRLTTRELLEQDEGDGDDDVGAMDNYDQEEDEEPVKPSPKHKAKAKADPPSAPTPKPTPKGKGRALSRVEEDDEDDMEVEDDIARGMQDVDQGGSDDEEVEDTPPKKRIKGTPAPTAKPKVIRSRPLQKENRDIPEGVRRSQRIPYAPLEFWRNEKIVYGPREPGQKRQVPHIKEIIRIPKEPPPARRGASKRKRGPSRTKNESTPEVVERVVEVEVDVSNPELGWDDDTDPTAVVLDYHSAKTVTRRVAFTAKMFKPAPAKVNGPDDAWSFEKIFGDGDFMAAGQLVIPEGKRKPGKGTKDNTYIFFVVEGAVNVMIHDTSVVLATGGMFMVPRGNSYFIENIAERPAKLFFTQARKMRDDEEEEEPAPPRGVSVAMGARSGSSVPMGGRSGSTASVETGGR
ncbi:Mif2/CENP-C like-domain-containing protein [Mycena galopus ATCC 62051]|nr:Mif2/CENP-C like-domain-containing protein [Mycena galopus ATCC 62051]